MDDPVVEAILTQYFRRLEQALGGLPAERRTQIVEDVHAHVEECLQAESDRSDVTVMAILDRVGDPDEIAREALADETLPPVVGPAAAAGNASTSASATRALRGRWRLTAPGLVLLVAAVVAVISLASGGSPASANKASGQTVHGSLVAAHSDPAQGGWLPASDVSGDHQSPGASSCGPQTVSGSVSAGVLEGGATKVASGSVAGHAWSLWSRNGQSGANALENGGLVVDGTAHGLCPGFPNPGEMELLEPSGGGDGIAYGVVGYPGTARVAVYSDTFGNFAATKLVGSTTAQKVNGVGFFITSLSVSGCDLKGAELNTASSSYATEHNLAFATGDCKDGQLVPISDSQGIWALPTSGFPNKFQSGGGGGAIAAPVSKGGWLPASDVSGDHQSPGASSCGPQTVSGSVSAGVLEGGATKVASGSVAGHAWSLWSRNGQSGANALENGGLVVDGTAHGLCPGFPNPGEMELLEPSGGGDGIAYGVVGYPGTARVAVYSDTFGNFAATKLVGSTTAQKVNGVGFFITSLSVSGCDLKGAELNTASSSYATEHNLAFATGDCKDGQLVPISDSQGAWQLPKADFPNKFGATTGAGPTGSLVGAGPPSRTGPDFSSCSPRTDTATSGQATTSIAGASQVASGTIGGKSWSLWSKQGEHGSAALEDAGVILDGHAYGICPGVPNPAEFELIDPSSGAPGIVIGVSGYDGGANIKLSVGAPNSFAAGTLLFSGHTVSADGTGFFIAQLPKSACDYSWLVLNVKANHGTSQHLLGFGSCSTGKLTAITGGQGAWSGP